jgi:hypothetical protein
MTNEQRAVVAGEAITAYQKAGEYKAYSPSEILPELLGDLLGDLRHWAAKVGVDFEQCDRNARACFENEVKEEADDTGKECTCDDRSWYGDQHDSACDFAGEDRE